MKSMIDNDRLFFVSQYDDYFKQILTKNDQCYLEVLNNLFVPSQFTDVRIKSNVMKGKIKNDKETIFETERKLITDIEL